jgi:hypothetical protein
VRVTDNAGNITYLASSNDINLDVTAPSLNITDDVVA